MMNERIRLIAEKAFEPINAIASEGVADRHTFDQSWFQIYNQKFAELIVKECADIVYWGTESKETIEQHIRSRICNDIKNFFGVE